MNPLEIAAVATDPIRILQDDPYVQEFEAHYDQLMHYNLLVFIGHDLQSLIALERPDLSEYPIAVTVDEVIVRYRHESQIEYVAQRLQGKTELEAMGALEGHLELCFAQERRDLTSHELYYHALELLQDECGEQDLHPKLDIAA